MKKIILIFTTMLLFVSCGEPDIKVDGISNLVGNNIFLGQKISVLEKERGIEGNDTGDGYIEKLKMNQYFDFVYYNTDNSTYSLKNKNSVEFFIFENFTAKNDSLAYVVLDIVTSVCGGDFEIYSSKDMGKVYLLWKKDGYFVGYSFYPISAVEDKFDFSVVVTRERPIWFDDLQISTNYQKSDFLM